MLSGRKIPQNCCSMATCLPYPTHPSKTCWSKDELISNFILWTPTHEVWLIGKNLHTSVLFGNWMQFRWHSRTDGWERYRELHAIYIMHPKHLYLSLYIYFFSIEELYYKLNYHNQKLQQALHVTEGTTVTICNLIKSPQQSIPWSLPLKIQSSSTE